MQQALRITTTVLPNSKIEITAPELPPGTAVEVIILVAVPTPDAMRSAVDVLAEAPGQRAFKTVEDVTTYISQERAAWDT